MFERMLSEYKVLKKDIKLALPGLTKEDLEITYEDGYIQIQVTTEFEKDNLKSAYNGFIKRFYVGTLSNDVKASMDNGLLMVNLKPDEVVRKIEFE